MMVRKRSNHQMEDYISYAKRSNVSEIIIIDGNGIEKRRLTKMRYLTFALAKGRLAKKSLEMFEKSELPVKR